MLETYSSQAGNESGYIQRPPGISYKEFKALSTDKLAGTDVVVAGISPSKLWVSQDWISPPKLLHTAFEDLDQSKLIFKAYYRDLPTGQRAIILANGHHHALRASEQSIKVRVQIVGPYPEGRNFQSFSRYRREVGNPFRM